MQNKPTIHNAACWRPPWKHPHPATQPRPQLPPPHSASLATNPRTSLPAHRSTVHARQTCAGRMSEASDYLPEEALDEGGQRNIFERGIAALAIGVQSEVGDAVIGAQGARVPVAA